MNELLSKPAVAPWKLSATSTRWLESGVGSLGRLRERVLSRHRGRRAPLAGVTITNERGMPGKVSLTVTTDVITQDYQLRCFSCNGAQFGAINEGIFPEGMPQDMVDAINFTLELHKQGHGAFEEAVARAQIHRDRQDRQDAGDNPAYPVNPCES